MMVRALHAVIPMDFPPEHGLRESLKGVVNYRVRSATNGREWTVDIRFFDAVSVKTLEDYIYGKQ